MLGLIWLQTVRRSDGISERIFREKNNFEGKISAEGRTQHAKIYIKKKIIRTVRTFESTMSMCGTWPLSKFIASRV